MIYLHILKQGLSLKRLGLISRANNDDIGICEIWRNDGKSPVWITEWNQRWSSTIKEKAAQAQCVSLIINTCCFILPVI